MLCELHFLLDTFFQEPYTFPNCNTRVADSMHIEKGRIDHGNSKEGSQESTRQEGSKEDGEEEVILRQEDSGNTPGDATSVPQTVSATESTSFFCR